MEYMEAQMQTAMEAAEASYRHDVAFRRFVDSAVHQAMRHLDHVRGDVEPRDVHHVAITAAMAALHLSMESDAVLKQLTYERDRYKELAEKFLHTAPPASVLVDPATITPSILR